jgi:hypothetical protein
MRKAAIFLLLFALASTQGWADSGPGQTHAESIRKKVVKCLDQHRRVIIETYDGTRFQGAISEAGSDDFVLSFAGRTTTLSYRDVKKITWPSSLGKQVKIAVAAALIVGTLVGVVTLIRGLHNG